MGTIIIKLLKNEDHEKSWVVIDCSGMVNYIIKISNTAYDD